MHIVVDGVFKSASVYSKLMLFEQGITSWLKLCRCSTMATWSVTSVLGPVSNQVTLDHVYRQWRRHQDQTSQLKLSNQWITHQKLYSDLDLTFQMKYLSQPHLQPKWRIVMQQHQFIDPSSRQTDTFDACNLFILKRRTQQ